MLSSPFQELLGQSKVKMLKKHSALRVALRRSGMSPLENDILLNTLRTCGSSGIYVGGKGHGKGISK